MAECRILRAQYRERRSCLTGCKGVSHNGQLSCNQGGRCIVTSDGDDFHFTLHRRAFTSDRLCRQAAIGYACDSDRFGSCSVKYMQGVVQFTSSLSVKECEKIAQQEILNMPCVCFACDECSRCTRSRMFCTCSVFDQDVTTQYSTKAYNSTKAEVTTLYDATSHYITTISSDTSSESNTKPATVQTERTTQLSNNTTEHSTYISTRSLIDNPKGNNMSIPDSISLDDGVKTPILLGGILGGFALVGFMIILSIVLRRRLVNQRRHAHSQNFKNMSSTLTEVDAPYMNSEISMEVNSDRNLLVECNHTNVKATYLKEQGYTNSNHDTLTRNDICCNGSSHSKPSRPCTDQVYVNTTQINSDTNDDSIYNVPNEDTNKPKCNEDEYGNLTTIQMNKDSDDDTIYNVLNEHKIKPQGNNEEYGHLRMFSKNMENGDYDDFRQSGKSSFAEPEDIYDHTKAVHTGLFLVHSNEQDYDHITMRQAT